MLFFKKKFSGKPFSEEDFKALSGLWKIDRVILDTLDYEKLVNNIVNTILTELGYLKLGYEIIVLTLVDNEKQIMKRVAISKTETARRTLEQTPIPFSNIEVPLSAEENLLVKAVKDRKVYVTHDLSDVLFPAGTRDVWRRIQEVCGIKTSVVYPVIARNKVIGAMIFSLSKSEKEVGDQEWEILAGFTNAVGVALENASLYRKLTIANQKLKELDKRKNEFLSVAAHELRAPMTAIKGYLSMILEGDAGEVNDTVEKYLKQGVEGNDRLIRLVNNMLNISRIEEGKLVFQMGMIDLKKVVEQVFNEFKTEAGEKRLEFKFEIPGNLTAQVYVDQDRIHEVVNNLISNALKYTNKGSVIIKLVNPSQQVIRFEVTDTGEGVSEKDQNKLFQKFFRAESTTGKKIGSGLGLYISKLLIEKFEGKIGCQSELGRGSTFWFELPLTTEERQA